MSALLKAYHRLPPFTRGFVASAHGLYLRRWRYGPETDSLAAEALKRDHWPKEQWEKWQQAKLARVLRRAVESVPWYRQDWERKRAGGALGSPDEFKNWRILRKEDVRANPKAFLADNVSLRRLHKEHTSGTTGTPLSLWRSREAARQWYALMEARWRGWYGLSRHDPWAILGGQLVTPVAQRTPPFWVWNAALKQLYLSSYHLSSETCASYFGALRERRVVYLWGYASSLFSLALFAREQRLNPPELKVVISNAEPLPAHERELMQSVFGCPVRDTYGMSEMVCAASECEHGRLHLWPDAGLVEVLADEADEPVPVGTVGRLVSTSLIEDAMLLIRYEVGDRGALADPANRCPCGRNLARAAIHRRQGRGCHLDSRPSPHRAPGPALQGRFSHPRGSNHPGFPHRPETEVGAGCGVFSFVARAHRAGLAGARGRYGRYCGVSGSHSPERKWEVPSRDLPNQPGDPRRKQTAPPRVTGHQIQRVFVAEGFSRPPSVRPELGRQRSWLFAQGSALRLGYRRTSPRGARKGLLVAHAVEYVARRPFAARTSDEQRFACPTTGNTGRSDDGTEITPHSKFWPTGPFLGKNP